MSLLTYKMIPIPDLEVRSVVESTKINLKEKPHVQDVIDTYLDWLNITLPDGYEAFLTDGVTGAYENFEYEFSNFKTVTLRGEYPYHRSIGVERIESLEDLKPYHKLIISNPFAADGLIYQLKNINNPVFLDAAYIGLIDYNKFNFPSTLYFSTSLSKAFATGLCRLGICIRKKSEINVPMKIINEYGYLNKVACDIGIRLMNIFNVNYMFEKYRQKQFDLCNKLELMQSDCVNIGYSYDDKWQEFNREGTVCRICLSNALIKDSKLFCLESKFIYC